MKKAALFILLISISSFVFPQNEGVNFIENKSFDEVLKMAKQEGKMIFVDCYAVWCGPCRTLSEKTFPSKRVGDFFNSRFINVKYDVEKGHGEAFYKKYVTSIPGLPTMLLLNEQGNIVHIIVGFRDGDALIAEIEAGLQGKTLPLLEKRYNAGERDIDFMLDYAAALKSAYKSKKLKEIVQDYTAKLPVEALIDKNIWTLAGEFIDNPYSPSYQFVVKNINKYEARLKINTSALERQLMLGMRRASNDLLKKYSDNRWTSSTNDSLKILKNILAENILKDSHIWLAKFKILDFMQKKESDRVYNFLKFAQEIGLFRRDQMYLKDVYSYLADNMDSAENIMACVEDVNKIQSAENKLSISCNLYDVIAKLNYKLGKTVEGDKAMTKYKELEQTNREKVEKLSKSFKK